MDPESIRVTSKLGMDPATIASEFSSIEAGLGDVAKGGGATGQYADMLKILMRGVKAQEKLVEEVRKGRSRDNDPVTKEKGL